jgi:hypothetical protein
VRLTITSLWPLLLFFALPQAVVLLWIWLTWDYRQKSLNLSGASSV